MAKKVYIVTDDNTLEHLQSNLDPFCTKKWFLFAIVLLSIVLAAIAVPLTCLLIQNYHIHDNARDRDAQSTCEKNAKLYEMVVLGVNVAPENKCISYGAGVSAYKEKIFDIVEKLLKISKNLCITYIIQEFASNVSYSKPLMKEAVLDELRRILFQNPYLFQDINMTKAVESFDKIPWSLQLPYVLFTPNSSSYRNEEAYKSDMEGTKKLLKWMAMKSDFATPRILIGDRKYFQDIDNIVQVYSTNMNVDELTEKIVQQLAKQEMENPTISELSTSAAKSETYTATVDYSSTMSNMASSTFPKETDSNQPLSQDLSTTTIKTKEEILTPFLSSPLYSDQTTYEHSSFDEEMTTWPSSFTESRQTVLSESVTEIYRSSTLEYFTAKTELQDLTTFSSETDFITIVPSINTGTTFSQLTDVIESSITISDENSTSLSATKSMSPESSTIVSIIPSNIVPNISNITLSTTESSSVEQNPKSNLTYTAIDRTSQGILVSEKVTFFPSEKVDYSETFFTNRPSEQDLTSTETFFTGSPFSISFMKSTTVGTSLSSDENYSEKEAEKTFVTDDDQRKSSPGINDAKSELLEVTTFTSKDSLENTLNEAVILSSISSQFLPHIEESITEKKLTETSTVIDTSICASETLESSVTKMDQITTEPRESKQSTSEPFSQSMKSESNTDEQYVQTFTSSINPTVEELGTGQSNTETIILQQLTDKRPTTWMSPFTASDDTVNDVPQPTDLSYTSPISMITSDQTGIPQSTSAQSTEPTVILAGSTTNLNYSSKQFSIKFNQYSTDKSGSAGLTEYLLESTIDIQYNSNPLLSTVSSQDSAQKVGSVQSKMMSETTMDETNIHDNSIPSFTVSDQRSTEMPNLISFHDHLLNQASFIDKTTEVTSKTTIPSNEHKNSFMMVTNHHSSSPAVLQSAITDGSESMPDRSVIITGSNEEHSTSSSINSIFNPMVSINEESKAKTKVDKIATSNFLLTEDQVRSAIISKSMISPILSETGINTSILKIVDIGKVTKLPESVQMMNTTPLNDNISSTDMSLTFLMTSFSNDATTMSELMNSDRKTLVPNNDVSNSIFKRKNKKVTEGSIWARTMVDAKSFGTEFAVTK